LEFKNHFFGVIIGSKLVWNNCFLIISFNLFWCYLSAVIRTRFWSVSFLCHIVLIN